MKKFERLGNLLKIIGKAAVVVLSVLFQTSFIAALPWPFNYFNFVRCFGFSFADFRENRRGHWHGRN